MTKPSTSTSPAAQDHDHPRHYVSRDQALSQLSPADAALVCAAEAAASVGDGEEYLDLHHLDRGVRKAESSAVRIGNVLPKRAVSEQLWAQILTLTPSSRDAV